MDDGRRIVSLAALRAPDARGGAANSGGVDRSDGQAFGRDPVGAWGRQRAHVLSRFLQDEDAIAVPAATLQGLTLGRSPPRGRRGDGPGSWERQSGATPPIVVFLFVLDRGVATP